MEIKDNTFSRQFEASINGNLISLEYSMQERKIFLTRLNFSENVNDKEVAQFVETILDGLKEQKMKVVPTTPKIISFFRKNSSYKEMLPHGIVI